MNDNLAIHAVSLTRRHFFRECGVGVGKIALAGLLTDALEASAFGSADTADRP